MSNRIFGTDGIRGRANAYPITAEIALKVGMAAGRHFTRGAHKHRVVIGKDTRRSSYMLENALAAGFTSMGFAVTTLGPVPTPAVGMLVRSLRADLGVMISASHNLHHDNGIKLFGPDGFKLSDDVEDIIEAYMKADMSEFLADPVEMGKQRRLDDGRARYIEFAKATIPRGMSFEGLKIVVDCAHGAAYRTAPDMLWELGAEIVPLGVAPNGLNINDGCGSTNTKLAQDTVVAEKADLGICLDGDADRVHIIDNTGTLVDGDQIMALITRSWARQNRLRGGGLVTTVMSNLGLERLLAEDGLTTIRTKVGDRYVVEAMRAGDYNIGGEQSGHVVLSDFVTTGDGTITALQVLSEIVRSGKQAADLCRQFEPLPQLLQNVRFERGQKPLETDTVKAAIAEGENRLNGHGRLLIRVSGTEPVIRVMGEGEDPEAVKTVVDDICREIEGAVG
jgi:phosphoglucosamine mutase